MKRCIMVVLSVVVLSAAGSMLLAADVAGWEDFVIRKSTTDSVAPSISDDGASKLFQISLGGQKAAWGTNIANGHDVGDILAVSISRNVSTDGWGPYMNLWVTDGQGGYAVLSNEPSHPAEWEDSSAYDTTWDVLKDATTWVYEVNGTQGFKLPNDAMTYSSIPAGTTDPHFTFGDFADYAIATPTIHWGGAGAPDDLNAATYTAYGFNWVFGDTQSNYLNGYLVSNPSLTVVPEPSSLALLAAACAGLLACVRRR